MITAKEAIKLTEEYNNSYIATLNKIDQEIERQSKLGERSVVLEMSEFSAESWKHIILGKIPKELEKLGYQVEDKRGRYMMISWYEEEK